MERCPSCAGDALEILNCAECNGTGVISVPQKIFLQTDNIDEITWCVDKINDNDIEYALVPVAARGA